jgi:hypothetical protein
MPETGIEPVRSLRDRRILSPVRLPVPPLRQKNGGRNRARTCDPLLVRQVLSQLSYAPVLLFKILKYILVWVTGLEPATSRTPF